MFGEKLLASTPERICPTNLGMFYADSIAALLAEERLNVLRRKGMEAQIDANRVFRIEDSSLENTNTHGHM